MKPQNEDPFSTLNSRLIDLILILSVIMMVVFMIYTSPGHHSAASPKNIRDQGPSLAVKQTGE